MAQKIWNLVTVDNLSLDINAFKGSGIEKGFLDQDLEKGKKVPVGTVTNGYKKVAEGKWMPVKKEKKKNLLEGTKAVGSNGKPIKLYHAGSKELTVSKGGEYGDGVYLTERKGYSEGILDSRKEGSVLHEVYLNVKNPLEIDGSEKANMWDAYVDAKNDPEGDALGRKTKASTLVGWLKEMGFDSLKINNPTGDAEKPFWLAFNKNQVVKSSDIT